MHAKYLIADIENDNTGLYKRTAGNFMFDDIVSVAFKPYDSNVYSIYKPKFFQPEALESCIMSPEMYSVMVGFNFKHDMLFLWKDECFQWWLQQGGTIFDCQLAEFYLGSFQHKYPALRETAVQYGCAERPKTMEPYWDAGWQTSEIDSALVLYDNELDVQDTEHVYLKQTKEIQNRGIQAVIQLQNEALLATTEIEFNGIKIDLDVLRANKQELISEIEQKEARLYELLKPYCNGVVLNWRSVRTELPLIFFGGTHKTTKKKLLVDSAGVPILVKSGANTGALKYKNEIIETKIPGLGINKLSDWMTEAGNVSLDDSVIQDIISACSIDPSKASIKEICELISDLRSLEKDKSTYFDSVEELTYPDSILRGKIHHTGTVTARTSSSDPNLQNIPGVDKSKAKYHFVSRYL